MNLIHRELAARFLGNLLRAQLVLMIVVVCFQLPAILDSDSGPITWGLAVAVAEAVLPFALLVATLFTIGSMAHHQELTALRCAGRSMVQITLPLIVVGVAAAAFSALVRQSGLVEPSPAATPTARAVAVHSRQVFPLTNLLAVVAGITLASRPRRASRFAGFGWALAVLAGYYVVSAVAVALGNHGVLHPLVAGWFTTVAFAGLGGVLWWRMEH